MAKYRKKPVVIEAVKGIDLMVDAARNWSALPKWFVDLYESGGVVITDKELHIKTLEGTMIGGKDDMIICGVNGEVYPCKPDIFEKTYEKVEAD